jgi:hypothetical protein
MDVTKSTALHSLTMVPLNFFKKSSQKQENTTEHINKDIWKEGKINQDDWKEGKINTEDRCATDAC